MMMNPKERMQHQKNNLSKNVKCPTNLTSPTMFSKFVLYNQKDTHMFLVSSTEAGSQQIENIFRTFQKEAKPKYQLKVGSVFSCAEQNQRNFSY